MSSTQQKSGHRYEDLLGRRVLNLAGEFGRIVAVVSDGTYSVKWENPDTGRHLPRDTKAAIASLKLV